jgi:hypothetical protein
MYPVPTTCQVCGNHYQVTKLHCSQCHSSLEGQFHFSQGSLHKLTAEQLKFVEIFLICEGKINRVENELAMSYPAVRARLSEIVQALGGKVSNDPVEAPEIPAVPPTPPPAVQEDKRKAILAKVSSGELSAQEAAALLRQL